MDKMVAEALTFAAFKHRHHTRDEGLPYIIHPIDVATLLVTEGGITDPVTLAAALLHDTVEDTDTTLEEIAEKFGPEVAAIVAELTDDQDMPHLERYELQMEKMKSFSQHARLIKMGDKISNLRDAINRPPPAWSEERLRDHFAQALRVRQALRGTNLNLETLFDEIYAKL